MIGHICIWMCIIGDMETSLIVEKALVQSECAIIMITHDERQALRMAHKRLILTSNNTV